MSRVWKWNRPVTVREVLEDLQKERSIAYTTVMTVLDNLHQKGWVRREAEGRAYRYEAVSTRAAYAAALMNDAWSQSDNPAAALVAFFGMMSEEQRQALRDAVRIVQGPETQEPTEPSESARPAERPEGAERPERTEPGEGGTPAEPAEAAEGDEPAEPAEPREGPPENPASAQDRDGR
ncbi:BlaI/MecI/CopY family transcriptional regulator [Streptomyces olindensis]|uniref:BlaI/MecI/CopY family transcriptional regulator n=1 Tax=Streptomyces olindensis TaxID=358823 RepID=UPI0036544F09